MLERIQSAFELQRHHLGGELNSILELMVELGIYPNKYQRVPYYEAGLTAKPTWSLEELGPAGHQLAELEKQWKVLRKESLHLLEHHNWTLHQDGVWTRGEESVEKEGKWQQLVFSGLGFPQLPDKLCSAAPTLCNLAAQISSALTCPSGQIKLSVLQGSSRVAPHCGLTNTKLRAHLPLMVPQDVAPRLRVAEEEMQWREGNFIVFDDSFEHEVWNESNKTRIVLIVDINHPELSEETREWYQKTLKVVGQGVDGPKYNLIGEEVEELSERIEQEEEYSREEL